MTEFIRKLIVSVRLITKVRDILLLSYSDPHSDEVSASYCSAARK